MREEFKKNFNLKNKSARVANNKPQKRLRHSDGRRYFLMIEKYLVQKFKRRRNKGIKSEGV